MTGLLALATTLTYLAGGTVTPFPHLFYMPVVVAAGALGTGSGLIAAAAAGLLCGPLMPLDVEAGTSQTTSGWLIRLGFFAGVGLVVGLGRNRLLSLGRARQDFLSAVSHELRTPLASVVGFASVLADRADALSPEEISEFAQLIQKEATELSNVVDHYVLEGRLDGSALFIDPRPTDLRRVLDLVLDGLPDRVVSNRITVAGSQVVCLADPLRLRQILRSVLNNALALTHDRISVKVTAGRGQARVTVCVGSGSPPHGLSELAPLQAPPPRARVSAPPLGIGLAVSRDLARRMGGDLDYRVDGTTSFELRLPLVEGKLRSLGA